MWNFKSCYIYGAGNAGKLIFEVLQNHGITAAACLDRSPEEKTCGNIKVLSPDDPGIDRTMPIIIGVYNPAPDADHYCIAEFLKQLGFNTIIPFLKFYVDFYDKIGDYNNLSSSDFYRDHQAEIQAADGLWADEKSRLLYQQQIAAKSRGELSGDFQIEAHCQYFPSDVPFLKSGLKFADLGAYDGDTIAEFICHGLSLEQVWAFEPDPENFRKLSTRIKNLNSKFPITLFPCGVGDFTGQVNFCTSGDLGSHVAQEGVSIPVCRLDDILFGEFPNYIKLDIEGFEEAALNGMRKIITQYHPMLAICVYHKPEDIFRIPLLLNSWEYPGNFYLRQHCGNFFETVCYAIPTTL
ncbi:MAG: FkbM family methyltransferase [Victivallales bacterium]|jgi:FkbM family methyltransferase|nr:FkbM family methyltransferase [Victivallales bacterium]